MTSKEAFNLFKLQTGQDLGGNFGRELCDDPTRVRGEKRNITPPPFAATTTLALHSTWWQQGRQQRNPAQPAVQDAKLQSLEDVQQRSNPIAAATLWRC